MSSLCSRSRFCFFRLCSRMQTTVNKAAVTNAALLPSASGFTHPLFDDLDPSCGIRTYRLNLLSGLSESTAQKPFTDIGTENRKNSHPKRKNFQKKSRAAKKQLSGRGYSVIFSAQDRKRAAFPLPCIIGKSTAHDQAAEHVHGSRTEAPEEDEGEVAGSVLDEITDIFKGSKEIFLQTPSILVFA